MSMSVRDTSSPRGHVESDGAPLGSSRSVNGTRPTGPRQRGCRIIASLRRRDSMDRSRGRFAAIWESPIADNRRSSSDVAARMDGKSRVISGADTLSRAGTPISLAQGPPRRVGGRAGVKGVVTCAI
ncbi:hypothetical protein ALC57_08526 [Trachymyrmex cornetzi]|uniref:Uncharacterized protein n=1 Tax=Trachymyrmex cornetzi TaxID=471704 RepID=A0A195E1Z8_9HYME|nr:hypothetical protein ALC57_08526 [Trachymyrmex cornetzi]